MIVVLEDFISVHSSGCSVLGLFQGEMRKEASAHGFYFWVTSSVFLPTEWIYRSRVKDKMHINYMTVCATSVKTKGSYGSVAAIPYLSFACLYDKAREEFLDWNRWDRIRFETLLPEKQPVVSEKRFTATSPDICLISQIKRKYQVLWQSHWTHWLLNTAGISICSIDEIQSNRKK